MIDADPSRSFPLRALSDARLTLLVAAGLFVLAAWPLLLVDLPPFQDLPNHVATAHIIAHPELYPEFGFNGLFKSNALLTLWFTLLGGHGLFGAARAFIAIVLAVNALALPMFVVRFSGRRALLVATLIGWPMVHSFSVVMGFLNFALAVGLSLILLTVIDRQRERPTLARGAGIAALSCVLWYAHPFPLLVVGALVALHAVTRAGWPARIAAGVALLSPLAPAALLSAAAARQHLVKAAHATTAAAGTFSYLNPWEIAAHFWTDVSGALTRWGSMTIVPALLLLWLAWTRRHVARPFFSLPAMAILAVAYVGLPVMMSNWWHLNCRLVPFLWAGLLLRLPETLPRPVMIGLAACALTFSAVTGVDYLRLDRDRAEFTAGIDAVPARARLLPLMFEKSKTSDFTESLTHAWGYYTVAKDASAPLVFGVERSYPVTYREFPPHMLIPPALDRFPESAATPQRLCKLMRQLPDDAVCAAFWRELWASFWREAEPRFSHVLTWAIPPEARPLLPAGYRRVFASGALEIYARAAAAPDSAHP
jgi:hypothetical protein